MKSDSRREDRISVPANTLLLLASPLCELAGQAGGRILEVYGTDFGVESKTDLSPVTEADRESHRIIARGLAELTAEPLIPDPLPILSEEGRDVPFDERRRWPLFWMVDPLDGTKEFVGRNGEFTVNIALIGGGEPLLGLVYAPVPDVLYFGAVTGGAYRLDAFRGSPAGRAWKRRKRIGIAAGDSAAGRNRAAADVLRVAGSRSHRSPDFERYLRSCRREYREIILITAGSSLKFCFVAEGKVDVYPRFGPTMEWDTAAGHAVALAAGHHVWAAGKNRTATERELAYNKRELINDCFICR